MALKSLSAKVARFFKLLEGMDDPIGDHISFLERRIDTLECDLHRLRGTSNQISAAVHQKDKTANWKLVADKCLTERSNGVSQRDELELQSALGAA